MCTIGLLRDTLNDLLVAPRAAVRAILAAGRPRMEGLVRSFSR